MISLSMNRARLKHKNFCTVRNYEIDKKGDMCSNNTVIRLYFDYIDNDLERDIIKRSSTQVCLSKCRITTGKTGYAHCCWDWQSASDI